MNTDEVADLLREAAETVIRPRFRALTDDQVIEKRPDDLVTVADREAEVLITRRLTAAMPGVVVIGEEAAFAEPRIVEALAGAEHAFVVDPVDGTRNFVHGREEYAVMAAEVRRGAVTRAWIWQPEVDRLYVAEAGAGTWRNGERLAPVARRAPYQGAASSRRCIGGSGPGVARIRPTLWCCGFDYPRLLEGASDFTMYRHGKPWDHLPGQLMLAELGGSVRTADGRVLRPGTEVEGLLAVADDEVHDVVAPLWARLTA